MYLVNVKFLSMFSLGFTSREKSRDKRYSDFKRNEPMIPQALLIILGKPSSLK